MQRNRIFKKVISVICALAMLLTAVYQPGWAVRSEAAKPMETTETLTELTWDSYVKTEAGNTTWVKGSVANNLHSDIDLSNTLFDDEIRFSADGNYIRYGGADGYTWNAPLQIGVTDGKLYVNAGSGTGFNASSTFSYDASYFGLPTFLGVPLNLKISMTNMREDKKSATVNVWINDQIAGNEFKVSSDSYAIGSNIVSNGYVHRDDNTLPPSDLTGMTELTWADYSRTDGETWVKGSVAQNLHSTKEISNTLFNDEIRFSADGDYIRYGGADDSTWNAPLQIGVTDGKLYVNAGSGTGFNASSTFSYDASYFGLPTFLGVPLNLKISMTNMREDKKSATVNVWINDQIAGNEFKVSSDSYAIGSNIVSNGYVHRDDNTLPPSDLTELTWDSYVKTEEGNTTWVKGSVANNLHSDIDLSNTLFDDEIKFSANGNYIRYGGAEGHTWYSPLQIGINEAGKLYVSRVANFFTHTPDNSEKTYDASYFGLPTFLGVPLNLKISMTNMNEDKTSATVSVWINDQIVGSEFTVSGKGYTIGSNIVADGYVYRDDNTLPPVISTEPEIKKITWQDFGVTAETTYKDGMTALSYDGTTLNNTEFEGDVTFSACSELRYGGLNGDQGLQLSVDNSGRFRILENTYTVEPIGDWSWPENLWNERVFTPADLGITEYESFAGQKITLRIKMEEVTETTAKVTIHINDNVVGGAFRMTSKDANTFKTGTVVGICCNGYGAFNPITVEPIVTNISWNDFAGVKYGVPYTTWTNYTYSEASLQYTELTGRVMFAAGGVLRIGGDAGLHIGAKTDGKLYVSSHTFGRYDYETGAEWTYDEEPKTYRIDTFANTPVDLKVCIGKISEDKKTVEKVELYINDVQVGNAFSMTATQDAYTIGNQLSLGCSDYGEGAGAVTILSDEAVPGELTSVTWEDFGITGSYVYNNSSSARTAHHFADLNNTLFNGDVKMAAGAHFRYGCDSAVWSGLQFTVNENGSLTINSDAFNWDTEANYTFTATQFGMDSFENTRFNLKIAMTDVTTTKATVGVWINNQMAGTYFAMTSTDAEKNKLGTTIWWATTAYDIVPYSNGRTYDVDSLTSIRLTDWPTYSGEEIGTELTHYEINGSSNSEVDSLVGTSFCETIKFVCPTSVTDMAKYMFCYGGRQGEGQTWTGLRIALVEDQMVLYGATDGTGSCFSEKWYLDAHTAGIAAFTNTEYQLRIDVVRLGKHALVYMYFDGVLYNNAPFVLEDFADSMSNTLVFVADVTDVYAILGASKKTLFDLYHDLGVKEGETSGYVLPTGLISAKKVEGSNETALNVSGGDTINEAGVYQIEFNDGVSEYSQKVYLYRAGDINQNDRWDAIDLVKMKKQTQEGSLEPSGIDAKTKDVNKDGIVNADDVPALRKRIVGSYQADSSEVMPVVGFYGPIDNSDGTEETASMNTVKEEVYDMIQDLGINTIVQYQNQYTDVASDRYEVYQQLTLAQNIGVKMTVQDYRLNSKANTATAEDVKNAIANYKNYQSFAGLYITDEPRSDSYPPNNNSTNTISHFSNLAKAVKQAGVWAYSNAKAYMYKEVKNKTASYQYKNYLTDYMDAFELDFLSSTYYPFFTYEINNGGVGNGVEDASQYFENLALVSAVANEKNVPFWRVIQSGDGFEMSDREDGNPSEGEFKWNVNTSLAFGAKGITYFQLVQDKTSYEVSGLSTTSGLIGATGAKNEWYDYAKEANAQIQAVGDVLMNATYQGFMANGTKAEGATAGIDSMKLYASRFSLTAAETLSLKKLLSYNGARVTAGDASYGAVTGCFTTKEGKYAMYVVNYDVTKTNAITVQFDTTQTVTYTQNAVTKTENVQTLQLNLAAGDAALIIFG